MTAPTEKPLSFKTYLSYGLLSLPMALVAITFYVFVPKYYADTIGVNIAIIGNIVILSRVWDAIIDPLMGNISDRSRLALGRRRPWILIALLPLAVSFVLLLTPQFAPSNWNSANWLALWTMLFFLFWTMVTVPYEALGAEISFDYDERTKLLGVREGALVLGTLLAGVFPAVYDAVYSPVDEAAKFLLLGVSYGIALVCAGLLCVFKIEERNWDEERRPKESLLLAVKHVLSNRPFVILLVSYTIGAFGAALPGTLILFYVEHVLGSDQGPLFLCLYFLIGFICLPLWVKLSARIGKKETWLIAMLINTGAFSGVFFLGDGDAFLYGVLVAFSALGYGATLAIPSSMQADVIDYDELENGTRKEGQFIGFWSIAKKLSAALGAGIAFQVLDVTGYQAGQAQNAETIFALRVLYAGVPCICNFVAILIAWRYPINRESFNEIRSKIDSRASGSGSEPSGHLAHGSE